MNKTDVIIPLNPSINSSLQVIIINSKYGTEVIPIESPNPRLVIVAVDEGQRVKFSIEEKRTVKIDPTAKNTPRSIFTYYTYNFTTEDAKAPIESNCDYFYSTCKTLEMVHPSEHKKAVKVKKQLKQNANTNSNNNTNTN
jgi:hypothetical protein